MIRKYDIIVFLVVDFVDHAKMFIHEVECTNEFMGELETEINTDISYNSLFFENLGKYR